MRDRKEIEEQMHKASDIAMEGGSKVPGMSYEEGVDNALHWALGLSDDKPIEDE